MLDRISPFIQPYTFDDNLIESAKFTKSPKFHCYPFKEPALVAGRGTHIPEEIHLDSARMDKIPIYRRRGGGGCVFLDPGNLIISAAFPAPGFLNIGYYFSKCISWLMNGLKRSGLKGIYQDGISDIVMGDKKIAGTCFHREKDFAYFSASILVSPDLDLMEKYLRMPIKQPEYRKGRNHREFLTGISRISSKIKMHDFTIIMTQSLKIKELI